MNISLPHGEGRTVQVGATCTGHEIMGQSQKSDCHTMPGTFLVILLSAHEILQK